MSDSESNQDDHPMDSIPENPLKSATVAANDNQNNHSAETLKNAESTIPGYVLQNRSTNCSEAGSVSQNTNSTETESFNSCEQLTVDNQTSTPMGISTPSTGIGLQPVMGARVVYKQARLVYKTQFEIDVAKAQGRIATIQTPLGSLGSSLLFLALKPLPMNSSVSLSLPSIVVQNLYNERDQIMRENRNLYRKLLAFHRQMQLRKG